MTLNEVPKPIINIPYKEPACHWRIERGEPPVLVGGRREACYYYRPQQRQTSESQADDILISLLTDDEIAEFEKII